MDERCQCLGYEEDESSAPSCVCGHAPEEHTPECEGEVS